MASRRFNDELVAEKPADLDYHRVVPVFRPSGQPVPHCPFCGKEIRYEFDERDEHSGCSYYKPEECDCGSWMGRVRKGLYGDIDQDAKYFYARNQTDEEWGQETREMRRAEYERLKKEFEPVSKPVEPTKKRDVDSEDS